MHTTFFKTLSILCFTLFASFYSCQEKENLNPILTGASQQTLTATSNSYYDIETGRTYALNPNRHPYLPQGQASPSARSIVLSSLKDWSGEVEIAIWEASSYGQNVSTYCTVDPGWICIGGGAWADYGTGPGALLTETRPMATLDGWAASSKDHHQVNAHTLHVYAVGLRLKNISATTLKQYISLVSASSTRISRPSASVAFSTPWITIGGGALVDYGTGYGNLLIRSIRNGNGWTAASKDHRVVSPAIITCYAIAINETIPGFGSLETCDKITMAYPARVAIEGWRNPTEIMQSGFTGNATGWVLACPGGDSFVYDPATAGSDGRLLFKLMPGSNGITTFSAGKDHISPQGGNEVINAVWIRKKP